MRLDDFWTRCPRCGAVVRLIVSAGMGRTIHDGELLIVPKSGAITPPPECPAMAGSVSDEA